MRLERALIFLAILESSVLSGYKYSRNEISPLVFNFTETVARHGYQSEVHTVVTEDGYMLTLFRLGRKNIAHGTPTLLMHGLLQSSDSWVDSGPDSGLAYLIAAAGHDIWIGNVRGNYYSRAHIRMLPEDPAFWDFCMDDIGRYDTPAMVDYILEQTGAAKLNYIGFSQGAGIYYIMCSERPGYCQKANVIIALSPSTRHLLTKSPLFRLLTEGSQEFATILRSFGIHEIFTKGSLVQETLGSFCQIPMLTKYCSIFTDILDSVYQLHKKSFTEETIKTLVTHFPSGTSVKNMARFGQAVNSKKFVKFDYGREKNLKVYGSMRPPEFNFSAVTVPVVTIYGINDGIVDIGDVEWSLQKLPMVIERFIVNDPLWSHLDMCYSKYTKQLVFPKINEYLMRFSYLPNVITFFSF